MARGILRGRRFLSEQKPKAARKIWRPREISDVPVGPLPAAFRGRQKRKLSAHPKMPVQSMGMQPKGQTQVTVNQSLSRSAPRLDATKCIAMLKKNGYSPYPGHRKASCHGPCKSGKDIILNTAPTHSPRDSHHREDSTKSPPQPHPFAPHKALHRG